MTDVTMQDAGYKPLISGRCIAKCEGQLYYFVESDVSYESSLFNVDRVDRHLMIGHRQVETAEHSGFSTRVKCLIESGERKRIELRDRIQAPIIDAHSPAAI